MTPSKGWHSVPYAEQMHRVSKAARGYLFVH